MPIEIVDMDHVAIRVSDIDDALGFYHGLLGLPIRDSDRYNDDDVPFVAVAAGGRHIHLVPEEDWTEASGSTAGTESTDSGQETDGNRPISQAPIGGEHLCLLIRSDDTDSGEDLDALLARIEAAGYTVEPDEPKQRYGAYGRDWAAYVRDPDGRRVELKTH